MLRGRLCTGRTGSRTTPTSTAARDRLVAALLKLGLKPMDRVLLQSANSAEPIIARIGRLKTRLVPTCTLPAHREQEIGVDEKSTISAGMSTPSSISFRATTRSSIPRRSVRSHCAGISGYRPSSMSSRCAGGRSRASSAWGILSAAEMRRRPKLSSVPSPATPFRLDLSALRRNDRRAEGHSAQAERRSPEG